jgi:hypothetical protein
MTRVGPQRRKKKTLVGSDRGECYVLFLVYLKTMWLLKKFITSIEK